MKRYVFFLYGVSCHLMFLGVFAYLAGFVSGLGPSTIRSRCQIRNQFMCSPKATARLLDAAGLWQ